jgi:hypothetical protein
VEGLAEQLLRTVAAQQAPVADGVREFVLDAGAIPDRQARRLLRPLLACLATKSAAENGTPANLYGGRLAFQRSGREGPVWIIGQFENRPGAVRVAFRQYSLAPHLPAPEAEQPPLGITGVGTG